MRDDFYRLIIRLLIDGDITIDSLKNKEEMFDVIRTLIFENWISKEDGEDYLTNLDSLINAI